MSDITVTSPIYTSTAAYAPAAAPKQAVSKPSPKYDVVDMSKPPTPEQAERMRSAGILGYGSVSAQKVTATNDAGVTAVTESCQNTFFDVVNEDTFQFSFKKLEVVDFWDSDFAAATTTQTFQSWDDGSWRQTTLYESAFSLQMHGQYSWCIPPRNNGDGTLSLAQFGPCVTATISGSRSVLTTIQSSGGQTQASRLETSTLKTEITIPSQERPAGAIDYNDWYFQSHRIDKEALLARLDQIAAQFPHGFDTRA